MRTIFVKGKVYETEENYSLFFFFIDLKVINADSVKKAIRDKLKEQSIEGKLWVDDVVVLN